MKLEDIMGESSVEHTIAVMKLKWEQVIEMNLGCKWNGITIEKRGKCNGIEMGRIISDGDETCSGACERFWEILNWVETGEYLE